MIPQELLKQKREKKRSTEKECREKAKKHEERAVSLENVAKQCFESGEANSAVKVLYERQKEILENQKAIMAELGIDD